jgi:alkanesulfonate monooxygenase SsuD/methylene tetrahydromethanopterin reductase-like flavin-dependent oxidoreductase (luciferase family)
MLIGAYLRLFGRPDESPGSPRWERLRSAAIAAESAGFDRVVMEDGLLYLGEGETGGNEGLWDPISIAAAIAASTTRIGISHAVLNNPYRHPAITARAAATLDEISGGRYSLGIGLGNTPDDYPRFGIPADRRFSRFQEALEVIADLLRTGHARFEGEFFHVPDGELVLRGPRPKGPPIVVAGGKPRMLRLAASLADEWNWWTSDPDAPEALRGLVTELDQACHEVGRDPATLARSIDLFSFAPPGTTGDGELSAEDIAGRILAWKALGFGEARINLRVPEGMALAEAVGAMSEVVALVHRG